MSDMATSIVNGRMPWGTEPKCVNCHTGVPEINTDSLLYRNSKGHGNIYCSGCHGSPHAMYPSREVIDNYQPLQYQPNAARVKSIGSCGGCHDDSRGNLNNMGNFQAIHGGISPSVTTGCNMCHTKVKISIDKWPHAFQWNNSNYKFGLE
jgi:hypothetical protein